MLIYTVKPGDTVDSIAAAYGIPVSTIVYQNQIPYPYRLAIGEALSLIHILLNDIFATKKIKISNITAKRVDAATLEIKLYVRFPEAYDIYDIFQLLKEYPQIKSIDI